MKLSDPATCRTAIGQPYSKVPGMHRYSCSHQAEHLMSPYAAIPLLSIGAGTCSKCKQCVSDGLLRNSSSVHPCTQPHCAPDTAPLQPIAVHFYRAFIQPITWEPEVQAEVVQEPCQGRKEGLTSSSGTSCSLGGSDSRPRQLSRAPGQR